MGNEESLLCWENMMWLGLLMLEVQFFFIKRWDLSFSFCKFFIVSFDIFKNDYYCITELIAKATIVGTTVALATGTIGRFFIQSHLFHLVDVISKTSNLPDPKISLLPKLWSMTEPEEGKKTAVSLKAVMCGSRKRRREIIHSATLQDWSLQGNKTCN